MAIRNVHLTEHDDDFIEVGVQSGRFCNASEVVCEGLRLLEQREEENKARIGWLCGAIQEGIDAAERGEYTPLHTRRIADRESANDFAIISPATVSNG